MNIISTCGKPNHHGCIKYHTRVVIILQCQLRYWIFTLNFYSEIRELSKSDRLMSILSQKGRSFIADPQIEYIYRFIHMIIFWSKRNGPFTVISFASQFSQLMKGCFTKSKFEILKATYRFTCFDTSSFLLPKPLLDLFNIYSVI